MVADEAGAVLGRVAADEMASSGVSPATGQSALTRIFMGASSTAIDLVIRMHAPLLPLYQHRPGRGRRPAVEAMLTMAPPPCAAITGTACLAAQ